MSAIRSGCTAPAAASSPWWCWLSSALSFTRSGIRPWKSPNGTRAKTVLTESTGRVGIDVPRDRDGTFEPQIVRKRQRRLSGVDEMVLSLYAKGLTTGEISAHFAEIYGAQVSKETISRPPTRCSRRCRPGSRRGCGIAGSEPGPVGSGLPGPHRSQTPPLGTVCLRSSTDTTL